MMEKPLQTALAISAILHAAALSLALPRHFLDKKPRSIRIAYIKSLPRQPLRAQPLPKRELLDTKDRLHAAEKMIAAARINKTEFARKQPIVPPTSSEYMPKPVSMQEPIQGFKKRVILPPLEINKIKNPSYTGYYEMVREKIRHAAYQNYGQTDTGDVYIAFVVGNDGNLKDVRYIDEKSSPSYYLKDVSLRSIQEAAPFPAFPRDLDYPRLSFNVIISFQIDNENG